MPNPLYDTLFAPLAGRDCAFIRLADGTEISGDIFLPGFKQDEIIRLLPQSTSLMGVPTFHTRLDIAQIYSAIISCLPFRDGVTARLRQRLW